MSSDKKLTRRELLAITGAASTAAAVLSSAPRAAAAAPKDALPQVPKRVLGKTKQEIPILLFGAAMKLDQRFDPKLAEAFRFGVNYIDTADDYAGGTSETAVGSFHTRLKNRDDLWITSKSCEHEPEPLVKLLNEGLTKSKTNRFDLYYLHGLKNKKYLNKEMFQTAERLKKEGKIRFFGFSCHNNNVVELMEEAAKHSAIDSIMFRYNFRQYGNKALNVAMDKCHKAGIGLIAMKTQSSESSFADAWKKYEQPGKWTKHQAVLKAVWADPRITAAVSHMDTLEKLKQNIAAAVDKTELGMFEHDALRRYAEATRSMSCDGCDHICNPAVNAPVQIGATMRYIMYHDAYGEQDNAKRLFSELPPEARRLAGVDFSAASRACPHGVDVAAHMARAQKIFSA